MPRHVVLVWTAAFLAAYLPDVGHGFVRDDFAWIVGARLADHERWLDIFGRHQGFYRPLVALSFLATERLGSSGAFVYGLTNLALAWTCGLLTASLGRALGLRPLPAALAGGVWLLNPHGINMGVLWISGRTSLLLTLFGVLAAMAAVRRHGVMAGACAFLAMLSKEEAVVLPLVLVVVGWTPGPRATRVDRAVRAVWLVGPALLALLAYLALRAQSQAMTPASAPEFYRFTFVPSAVAGTSWSTSIGRGP
jgi:hypothetical protein